MANSSENKKNIWFRAKEYGWGWYPISWQGWISMGIFIGLYVFVLIWLLKQKETFNILAGIIVILLLLMILFFICYKKGDKPGWRWNGEPIKARKMKK